MSVCSDCRVPLQDAPPAAPDHETITYDLADWDDGQRRMLELLLRGADIPFNWEAGSDLIVPRLTEAAVDDIIDDVEHRPSSASEELPRRPTSGQRIQPDERLATIGQRALARLIDAVHAVVPYTIIFVGTVRPTFDARQPKIPLGLRLLGLLLPFAYEVPLVALWGQTLGKRIVGIRIIGPDGLPPGWGRSLRRWLVPFALGMAPFIGWLLGTAVVLRAAFVDDRRGFHDLAAGTEVVQ